MVSVHEFLQCWQFSVISNECKTTLHHRISVFHLSVGPLLNASFLLLHPFVLSFNKIVAGHWGPRLGRRGTYVVGVEGKDEQRHTIKKMHKWLCAQCKMHVVMCHEEKMQPRGTANALRREWRYIHGQDGKVERDGGAEKSLHFLVSCPPLFSFLMGRESLGFWSLECPPRLPHSWTKWGSGTGIETQKSVAAFLSPHSPTAPWASKLGLFSN